MAVTEKGPPRAVAATGGWTLAFFVQKYSSAQSPQQVAADDVALNF